MNKFLSYCVQIEKVHQFFQNDVFCEYCEAANLKFNFFVSIVREIFDVKNKMIVIKNNFVRVFISSSIHKFKFVQNRTSLNVRKKKTKNHALMKNSAYVNHVESFTLTNKSISKIEKNIIKFKKFNHDKSFRTNVSFVVRHMKIVSTNLQIVQQKQLRFERCDIFI